MTWTLSAFADEAGGTIDEQIRALLRAGVKHVDLRGVDGFNITTLPPEKAKDVARKLAAAGITVGMYGSPIGKIDIADDFQMDMDKLAHLGRLAPILGCRDVRIFSYYNKNKAPKADWQKESIGRLTKLRDLAAKLGLVLYHENERHIFGDRCKDVLAIAREVRDGKSFKIIFDFDNFNQSGEDTWANWLKLREVVDGIHIKDSAAAPDGKGYMHMPAGQGEREIREILTDAVARNWEGPVTIEPHLSHSPAVVATGPSGQANQQLSQMSTADSFHVACEAAKKVLGEVKAKIG